MAEKKETEVAVQPVTVELLAEVLKALPKGLSAEDLQAILAGQHATQQAMVESTRTVRHSNPDHPHISVFSFPEGDAKRKKPTLTRETYFNNAREREDALTPAEIDAYNAITHSCEARDGTWTATIKRNRLFVTVPSYTIDDRGSLPDGLVLILRELALGTRAVTPADMAARITELERIVAEQGNLVKIA